MATIADVNARITAYSLARVGRLWTRSMHRGYDALLRERRELMREERRAQVRWMLHSSK